MTNRDEVPTFLELILMSIAFQFIAFIIPFDGVNFIEKSVLFIMIIMDALVVYVILNKKIKSLIIGSWLLHEMGEDGKLISKWLNENEWMIHDFLQWQEERGEKR